MKQNLAPVISNSKVMPEANLVWLESPQIAAAARPGQFVMVRCGEDTLLRRPLSVHQVNGGNIALLFSIVGKGTHWLAERKIGEKIDIFGPLGNGFILPDKPQHILLVAGGMGIAPLYFLAQEALKKELSVTLLYGTAIENHYSEVPPGIKLINATDDGSVGYHGVVTDLLPRYINGVDQIFACGPVPMYRTMAQMPELKNKPVQISLEVRMGCGLGVCYGCTIKTRSGLKQVCQDGPVFNLSDIVQWDELIL